MPRPTQLVFLLAVLPFYLIAAAHAQPAATVVTGCRDVQQPGGSNLIDAVARAATPDSRPVVFDCPAGTTITMSPDAAIEIRGRVVIDGENKITLEARGPRQAMFTVPGGIGASLVLRNIKIRGASDAELAAASVVFSEEPLVLDGVTIENSEDPIRAHGDLTVRNSRFSGNSGSILMGGDAVREGGTIVVEDSQFIANADKAIAVRGGKISMVRRSQFIGNDAGLMLTRGTVRNSLFQSNRTAGIVANGRGDTDISGNGFEKNGTGVLFFAADTGTSTKVKVVRNLFSGNSSGGVLLTEFGTAAPREGTRTAFDIAFNRFLRNSSPHGGAGVGVFLSDPTASVVTMSLRGSVFQENTSNENGGAVHWKGQKLAISHALFKGNSTNGAGSAIFAEGGSGSLAITNALFVENRGAGGAIRVGSASVLNVTIANNEGPGLTFAGPSDAATIANTLFSRNGGGNCSGVAARAFGRGNMQFGAADCPGVPVQDPFLDSLYVPGLGSPALAAGDGSICSAPPVGGVDLLFQIRAGGAQCTSGAYERPPVKIALRTPKLVKTCPDGTRLPPNTPCPEQLKTCPSGLTIPVGMSCPVQTKTCPGGEVVAVEAACPEPPLVCPGGFAGLAANQAFESNIDRPGNDLVSFDLDPFTGGFGTLESSCQLRCENDSRCRAWTFVRAGIQGPKARCWLKNAIPPARTSDCCTSGVVMRQLEPGTDRPGNDYSILDLGAPDPNACQAACQNDQRCAAWSYVKPGTLAPRARCCLKDAIPAAVTRDCCTSGVAPSQPNVQ